jgi:hypothetical protein
MMCRYLGTSGFNILEITFGNWPTHALQSANGPATVIGTLADRDRSQNKPPAAKEA